MPLQPQVIDIDMGLGLDTFTDPKKVVPGKFTTLENVRFRRGKRLEMRRGNVAFGETYKLGNTGSATNTFNAFSNRLHIKSVASSGDSPLLFGEYQDAAGSRVSGYRWASQYRDIQTAASRLKLSPLSADRPEATVCNTLRAETQHRPTSSVMMADSCVVGDRVVNIWSQGTAASHVVFADIRNLDGDVVYGPTQLSSGAAWSAGNGWVMAVAVSSTRAWLFETNNSTTLCRITIVDVTNPSWTNRLNYNVGSHKVDAVVLGSDVYVVGHNFDGGTGVVIKSAPTSTTTPLVGTFTSKISYTITGTLYCLCLARPKSGDTKLRVFWRQSSGGTYGASFTASSGSAVVAATLIYADTFASYQISAAMLGDNMCWVVASQSPAAGPSADSQVCNVSYVRETGSFGAITTRQISGMLASHVVQRTDTDTASFWVRSWNAAYTESAYFQYQIQNQTMCLSGRILGGRAHGQTLLTTTALHGVANTAIETSLIERTLLVDAYDVVVDSSSSKTPAYGLAVIKANYDHRTIGANAQSVNGCQMLAGGLLAWSDGNQISHHGIPLRPTIVTVSTNSTGGFMSNGTYSIVAVPYWIDARGNEHLGAPSDPFPVTLSAGGSVQRIVAVTAGNTSLHFVGTNPSLSAAASFAVAVPLYRYYSTTNGGTIYYRCVNAAGGNLRDCSDADLVTRDVLPTTGGVLPNATIDGPPTIGVFNDRYIASSPTDDGLLYACKPLVPGYAPEFSDELSLPISPAGGAVTAILELVDKCVVFKAGTIQVFTGEGFTANGAGGGYSPAETIYDTIGCPGPWAAVSTKLGIMFDSGGQGIWLLDRSLQLTFVGEAVDAYKDDEVQSCAAIASEDEVRFLLESGVTLCFNLDRNTWAVTTPTPCWDIGYVGGQALWLRKSESGLGGVYRDDDDTFTDAMNGVADTSAAAIQMQAVTGWLAFAGIQGYQRMWRALFTGDYGDVHTLLIDAGYDYDESTYPDSFSLSSVNSGTPYDGQVWMKRGFSKSVRFRLRCSSSSGDTVGPLSLTGLSFEVGVLPRAARLKTSKGA